MLKISPHNSAASGKVITEQIILLGKEIVRNKHIEAFEIIVNLDNAAVRYSISNR